MSICSFENCCSRHPKPNELRGVSGQYSQKKVHTFRWTNCVMAFCKNAALSLVKSSWIVMLVLSSPFFEQNRSRFIWNKLNHNRHIWSAKFKYSSYQRRSLRRCFLSFLPLSQVYRTREKNCAEGSFFPHHLSYSIVAYLSVCLPSTKISGFLGPVKMVC